MLLPSVSPTLLLLVYDSLSTSSTTTTSLCLYLQRPPFYPLLPRTSSSSSYYHQSRLLFYFSSSMLTFLLRHHRLCLQSELQPTPTTTTHPRLCRDPTPRHPHPQLQLLLSYYYYQAARYPVQYFYILLLVYVVIHHSPVPPTSPTTPSVADSVYVANLRLPGSKETPVHHLCRNPPSPWLNGDTRSSPVSKTCVFLAKRRHQFTTKSRHISHKYPVISELFPKSILSQFLKHDIISVLKA